MKASLGEHLGLAAAPVEAVVARAEAAGLPIFLVGGAVRDWLRGQPSQDADLVVEGDALPFAEAVQAELGGALRRSEAFRTATWSPGPGLPPIDLVTARRERYPSPGALPQIEPADIGADLARRDFTINAIALRLRPGAAPALLDPLGGAEDLQAGRIRALHPRSFSDDPTRAFRAARYAARLGAHLDPALLHQAADAVAVLPQVSLQRVGHELWLIGREAVGAAALDLVAQMGLLAAVEPAWGGLGGALLADPAPDPDLLFLRLAAQTLPGLRPALVDLVPGGKKEHQRWLSGPERVLEALPAFAGEDRPAVARALLRLDPVERRWAAERDPRALRWLAWWETEGQHLRCAVDGAALLAAGLPQGPAIRRGIEAARDAAWRGASAEDQLAAALGAKAGA